MPDRANDAVGSLKPGRYGAGAAALRLTPLAIAGAWNLQGSLSREQFAATACALCDSPLPAVANTTVQSRTHTALWLGPESWLLVARESASADLASSRAAINAAGGALFDVSAARIAYRIAGEPAAEVLAKSCPLDFAARAFVLGGCAQSLLGQMGALFYRQEATSWVVMIARSYAGEGWQTLCRSAARYGYEVTATEPFR